MENQTRLLLPTFFPRPLMVLVRLYMAKLYISVSIIIIIFILFYIYTWNPVTGVESAAFTIFFLKKVLAFIFACFFFSFAQKGKMMQTERRAESMIPPFSGPFPLNTWSRGVLLPSEINSTWQHETFIRSARACWLFSNVPTENSGGRIFSGSLCRAIFFI